MSLKKNQYKILNEELLPLTKNMSYIINYNVEKLARKYSKAQSVPSLLPQNPIQISYLYIRRGKILLEVGIHSSRKEPKKNGSCPRYTSQQQEHALNTPANQV